MPLPRGSLPYFVAQPLFASAESSVARNSQLPISMSFTVHVSGVMALRRRISIGSIPSSSAIMFSKHSKANRGCGTPWPRIAPQAGLLVITR
jgi:hypothetical protein